MNDYTEFFKTLELLLKNKGNKIKMLFPQEMTMINNAIEDLKTKIYNTHYEQCKKEKILVDSSNTTKEQKIFSHIQIQTNKKHIFEVQKNDLNIEEKIQIHKNIQLLKKKNFKTRTSMVETFARYS